MGKSAIMMYSPAILTHFFQPQHVGRLTADNVHSAMLGSPKQGAVVNLDIAIADNRIIDAAFMAYGNPGLIAIADYICEYIIEHSIEHAQQLKTDTVVQHLALPRALYGDVLLVEDTLKTVLANIFVEEY